MKKKNFVPFLKDMKKDYTILVPNMLPVHFKLMISVLKTYGYNMELLETEGPEIAETGLKYTHNDACYPAILVVGQFIHALQSGKYDPKKTALIMAQTGGGCRASNYISLIRKALSRAGYGHVPVISLSLTGLEKHPGFKLTVPMIFSLVYAVLYGDVLMSLSNQVKPYEKKEGSADALTGKWTEHLGREMGAGGKLSYSQVLKNCRSIVSDFEKIETEARDAVKVGIVGEIFVKYSPLANNSLEKFLISEGAEPVVPGLLDFCIYCVYNRNTSCKLYKTQKLRYPIYKLAYKLVTKKKDEISDIISASGKFRGWTTFDKIASLADGYINHAVVMGEGWLLTAEMLELSESGCKNIVCAQPFGCLPNHICGKGVMKHIKEKNPDVNILALDYDPGASRVNQENRLKLMLFNARKNAQKSDKISKEADNQPKIVHFT
ncbi:MAG: 2-hydroxyacyl-CoA dehydratase [Clostridia bacterium]|nr:2-hydroxyacyl-CoA dehydratase [Clostridia bacterium]